MGASPNQLRAPLQELEVKVFWIRIKAKGLFAILSIAIPVGLLILAVALTIVCWTFKC